MAPRRRDGRTQREWWASDDAQHLYWGPPPPWIGERPLPPTPMGTELEAYSWVSVRQAFSMSIIQERGDGADPTGLDDLRLDNGSRGAAFARWWAWWLDEGRAGATAKGGLETVRPDRGTTHRLHVPLCEIPAPRRRPRRRPRG